MNERDRDMPAPDWVDTTAGGELGRSGEAPGTGSLGEPPLDAPDGDAADSGTGAGGIMESDLGGVDIGGAEKPGAGLGGPRGSGFGSGA